MIVERLSLANFRGFDQLDLAFDERVTLLAGVNGVGKSGVLYALAGLLSRALPEFTPSRAQPVSFTDDDVQIGRDDATPPETDLESDASLPAGSGAMQVDVTLAVDDMRCVVGVQRRRGAADAAYTFWSERAAPGTGQRSFAELLAARTLTGDLDVAEAVTQQRLRALATRDDHPVAVLFSTRRDLPGTPRSLPKLQAQDVGSAYGYALQSREIALRDVMYWFRVQESEYGTAAGAQVLDRLREVIRSFAPEFTNLRVEDGTPPRLVVTKAGTTLDLRMLSDGERSLLALMFDLTRRLTIANPAEPDPITKGRGVVLVDEVEHHLHPSWQRRVLARLTDTFEGCQFVVTTHSPQVLGEVKPSSIRVLRPGQPPEEPERSFGLDSNAVLRRIQRVPIRTAKADELVGLIDQLVDHDRLDDARERLGELATVVGDDDTEVIRLGTMLDFLQTAG